MTTIAILGHEGHGKTTLAEAIRGRGGPYQLVDDGTCPANADVAVLVVSLPDGPMPGTRDALKTLPHAPRLVVLLNMRDMVEEAEIVDLVEMEVREMIAKVGRDGDNAKVVTGSALQALTGGHHKDRTLHDLFAALQV